MYGVKISGIGVYYPDQVITNARLAEMLLEQRERVLASGKQISDEQLQEYVTSDDWIFERTGIRERRFALPGVATSDLAQAACQNAWTDAYGDGLEPPDFVLVATVSPDHFTTPPTAAMVHRKMAVPIISSIAASGHPQMLHHFIGADITLACTSFMEALLFGSSLVMSGMAKRGIIVGADIMSRVISPNRRSPYVLLGDAAGAFVLEATDVAHSWFSSEGFLSGVNGGANGEFEQMIINRAGGSARPTQPDDLDPRVDGHLMLMDGRQVYMQIVPLVADSIIPSACARAHLALSDIDALFVHQANLRMIEGILERVCKKQHNIAFRLVTRDNLAGRLVTLANNKTAINCKIITVYINIDRFANVTSASIPLCVFEARELGLIKSGMRLMLLAFGGGFSWCSAIVNWA